MKITQKELSLTQALQEIIIQEIDKSNGSIPFSRYMELALYHPQLGYYNNSLYKFGEYGDFITSPMISNLFAKCISKQITEILDNSSSLNRTILEFGSGNGQLMLDLLSFIGKKIEHYYILELSHSLMALQKERIQKDFPQYLDKVTWINELPQNFNGIILANEVLDAQICEVFTFKEQQLYLRNVTYTKDKESKFIYIDIMPSKPYHDELLKQVSGLPKMDSGYTSEINLINRGFIKSLAKSLDTGAILLIDYGYAMDEYYKPTRKNGTLRGFFRHQQLDDVLCYPGLIDITSSVDFSSIVNSAVDNGLDFIDYTTQANFLINCGLVDDINKNKQTDAEYLKTTNQINRLVSPNGMGEAFKVMGLSKNLDFCDWVGFKHGSLNYLL